MRAPFEMNKGRENLVEIIDTFPPNSKHWNEAENRFQFVDRLLLECLGWERPNIRVEKTDESGGKADYVLGNPVKAILEAKRETKLFDTLPVGKPTNVRKLEPLIQSSKHFGEAVQQVLSYCVISGAQIAIVCNGPQLAVFQALTPGEPPLEGECFFFNGFEAYVENFSLLWSILSPEGITENYANRKLSLHRTPRIPPKASEFIKDPKRFRYRNNFQENLRAMSSVLLENIEDNPELKPSFYKECYVPIEANNRHLLLSKRIIDSRYKRSSDDSIVPSALYAAEKASTSGGLVFDDPTLVGGVGSRPIVVIGDVGVGKTSFFENLYQNLNKSEKPNTYFLHINLGTRASLSADIKTHVLSAIPKELKQRYRVDIYDNDFVNAIYHDDIIGFNNGVKGQLKGVDDDAYRKERVKFLSSLIDQKDNHLHASIGHLAKGRGKQIVLVMDNADQRKFETQQEAFLIAQELAATRNLIVFVALRPSTFHQSKETGALSGYQNKILTISPPPAHEVIKRRLTFALRVAEGKIGPAELSGIQFHLESTALFLKATLRSIKSNADIKSFLSNITGGNTRAVIEFITGFFGSPNVDSQKIVRIEEERGNYKVPLHEFTKHALLGEFSYFNSESSLIAFNIYDVGAADVREHFLASLIISFLTSNTGTKNNDGFVSGDKIMSEMVTHGFVADQVQNSFRRLAAKKLIETPFAHYRELEVQEHEPPEQFYFRATSVGIYHVRFWGGNFAFLDAVSTDTPIFDEDIRNRVFKGAESFDIKARYERTDHFKKYLENQWHLASINSSYYDFSSILKHENYTFDEVKRFIDKR